MKDNEELILYTGGQAANTDYHDGQLRPVVGVQNMQIMRANRTRPELADGFGWTYNHAPMLAHWKGTFYLEYLSDTHSEHIPPGQTLLMTSRDGYRWEKPQVVFPVYVIPDGVYQNPYGHPLPEGSYAVMHQRMGFYESPNGKLLVLGFYGICPHRTVHPNDGYGIGRVVREIHEDGSFSPVYFIRYNRHAGWNESNTSYPYYQTSEDPSFIEACDALLKDRLVTIQWWEEDRSKDGFYTIEGERAPSTYRLKDGRTVAVFKSSRAAISNDDGETWSEATYNPSLIMAGGKVWGQQTADGKYALIYNPSPTGKFRWPLAIVTGDDGLSFDNLSVINGEVSPRRYDGLLKDFGLSYMRGIEAGNKTPTGNDMWLTYSMNKEDIWISRIPVPVTHEVKQPVNDSFNGIAEGHHVVNWNIHSTLWAPVQVEPFPSQSNKSLALRDRDPYEFAKAMRVFPESKQVTVHTRLLAAQSDTGQLQIEVCDQKGIFPLRVVFDPDGFIKVLMNGSLTNIISYEPGKWYDLVLRIDVRNQSYVLEVESFRKTFSFFSPVLSVERIIFRTGPARKEPNKETNTATVDLPQADEPVEEAAFFINEFRTYDHA